ncbi:MAG TPA: DUF3501 family protein [Burkholderiaceae bacterium]|nr:DUF3501 family protein [Burkholderiaceae bacterium]
MNPAVKCALVASDLTSLETYAREHKHFHPELRAHRESRTVRVGPNAILVFEDALTVRHQIQEILRIEQITAAANIQTEIDRYATLIPDGRNLKATFMVEFSDAAERHARGPDLTDVEQHVWLQVDGSDRIFAAVDRSTEGVEAVRAPLVHHLRFELGSSGVRDLKHGKRLSVGIDHGACSASLTLNEKVRQLLLRDLR